jgi:hypothetical protein
MSSWLPLRKTVVTSVALAERDELVEHVLRVGAAVDVVADEGDRVALLHGQAAEQYLQLRRAARGCRPP